MMPKSLDQIYPLAFGNPLVKWIGKMGRYTLLNFTRIATLSILLPWSVEKTCANGISLAPVADTFMRDTRPDDNYGDRFPLLVGVAKDFGPPQNRALIKFDVRAIPTNAIVTNVTLTIIVTRSNTEESYFDLNRMLVDWAEMEVTWNNRFASVPWNEGGCRRGVDFASTVSANASIDERIFNSSKMATDVQSWIAKPSSNFGWILIATDDLIGTGKQIGSREDVDNQPTLFVEYTLNAFSPPTPPILANSRLIPAGFVFSFTAESNHSYFVEYKDSLITSNWSSLTNYPSQSTPRTILITNQNSLPQRYFRAGAL